MEKKIKRFDNIDLLKVFAIFCVVLIHSFWVKVDFWNTHSISSYLHYFSRTILATSVPIFFFCNGFLLFRKKLDLKKHICKTIHYIAITYIWAALTMYLLMPVKDEYMTPGQVFYSIGEWKLGWINHLWFMGPLVCIYIIFPILKTAVENNEKLLVYITVIVAFCTMRQKTVNMVLTIVHQQSMVEQFLDILNPFTERYDWAYVYFCLGGLGCLYQDKIHECFFHNRKKWNVLWTLVLIAACGGWFAYGVFMSEMICGHWNLVWEGYNTVFNVLSVLALYSLSLNYCVRKDNWFTKGIRIVSSNTLGIYFIHMVFVYMTKDYFTTGIFENNFLVQILYVLAILGMSIVITLGVKRIPVVKYLVV